MNTYKKDTVEKNLQCPYSPQSNVKTSFNNFNMVRLVGFEPTRVSPPPPQDGASAVPPQPHREKSLLQYKIGAVERI